jgi:argininosuccinate lyase
MTNYLWQASGAAPVSESIMEFLAGEDVLLDRELFPFDLQATAAHVRGLARIGILDEAESRRLVSLLEELRGDFEAGRFVLDERFEDGHSAIEAFLTERAGDSGARVHTGRSRNDQVAVATRLYLKDRLQHLAGLNGRIARACLETAERHANLPMPGYTHMQRAVPSSVGGVHRQRGDCGRRRANGGLQPPGNGGGVRGQPAAGS